MEINLNIQKRHLVIFFVGLFIILSVLIYAQGIQVDKSLPYHPLAQVSKSLTDDTSVDEDQDGIIDAAEVALNGGNGTGGGPGGGSNNIKFFSGVEQIPEGDGKITINLNDSVVFAYAASGRDSFTGGFYCNLIVSASDWHGNSFDIDYTRIGSGGCNTAAFTVNWFAVVAGGPDNDGDGYSAPYDCDDNDPDTYPGAPELDDGKDNDCDGNV